MKRVFLTFVALFAFAAGALAQPGEFIVPGSNLVVDGLPKIPVKLAERVSRYTEFRSATVADWHPTKREMLIHTRFGDASQIHHLKFPGGARTQVTFFPESVGGGSYDAKGTFFVFSKGQGGNERFQNYRFDLATGDTTLLTDGKSRNSGGVWSHARNAMAYVSTRRNGADVDLYVIQPADPKTDRLVAEFKGGGWAPLDWSPDDRQLLLSESISINESYLWLFDVSKGQKTLLTPRGKEKVAYGGGQFSKDGKGIYTTTDQDSEFRRLVYLDLETKKTTVLTDHIPWDIQGFRISPDGRLLAFVANEAGISTLRILDLKTSKETSLPKLPAGSVGGLHWRPDSSEFAIVLTSARSPADIYSVTLASGKIERWTESETGGLNTSTFAEPELVEWKSFDDRMISGFLYSPPKKFAGKRPVVIDIHGGPEAQFRPGFLARRNYILNEMGVAFLFPNIRGSSGFGKTFLQLDNGFLREDSYKDIGALFDWIAKRPDLDSERIMITGGSYGGHMTLAIATHYPERFRCAIDVVGMSNLVTFLENTESYRRDLRRVEYGDERDPKMRSFMERIAPLNNAHKIKRPLFIVQGKNDPRVPWTEAEQMVATLKKQKTPVWYLMANDEGHGFAKKKNADFQFFASVMFMERYLLNEEKGAAPDGGVNQSSFTFRARTALSETVVQTKDVKNHEWPGWLGPNRDGSTPEIIKPWKTPPKVTEKQPEKIAPGEGAPKLVWKQPAGEGHSSPIVADGKVFVHTRPKGKDEEALSAFNADTGELVWTKTYNRGKFASIFGNGPRATPTVAGGKVFTFGVTGYLTCFDAKTGDQLWQADTLKEFGAKNLFFGTSCSPLVDGDRVLLNVGGPQASLVALSTKDGSTIWKNLSEKASYASPIIVGTGPDRAAVFLTSSGLAAVAVKDGSVFWQIPLVDKLSESSTTPVRSDSMLFASSITFGGMGVKLSHLGGKFMAKELWTNPDLNCYFSTPVAVGKDHLYLVTGTKPPALRSEATLRCIEMATGKELWNRPKVGAYHASLTRTGDDKLLLLEEGGDLVLIEPSPKEYRETCRAKICGTTWAHPAIANGRLYIRDANELVCIELR